MYKVMAKDLKTLLDSIWKQKELWNFRVDGMSNESIDCNCPLENKIQKFFELTGKERPSNSLLQNLPTIDVKRKQHIYNIFFLGIAIYNDSAIIKDNIDRELDKYQKALRAHCDSRFPFVWFLIALYHDLGYSIEKKKSSQYQSYENLIEENGNLGRRDGVPELYESMIKRYFEYRMSGIYKGEKKKDLGIVAGHAMYHDLCEIRSEKKKTCKKALLWVKDLEEIYNLAAWVVTCHNMFFANADDICNICRYERAHLFGLMKEPQEYKIHFHDFPLFFLLCLVDNIEFVKRQDDINENSSEDLLQQIEYSLNDTEGYISLTVNVQDKELRKKIQDQISGIGNWLTKVVQEKENQETTYRIYFNNKEK